MLVLSLLSSSCHTGVEFLQPLLGVSSPVEEQNWGRGHRDQECGSQRERLKYCTQVLLNWLNSCLPCARPGLYSQSVLVTTQLSSIFPQGSIKFLKWGQGTNRKEMLRFLQNCFRHKLCSKTQFVSYLYCTWSRHASDRKVVPKRSRIIMLCSNNAFTSWPCYVFLFTTLSFP